MLSRLCVFVIERIQVISELTCRHISRNHKVVNSNPLAQVRSVRDPCVGFAANLEPEASVNVESEDHVASASRWRCFVGWLLTVKLRGRPEAPDWSRGCTLSPRTRGDTTDAHGPLQRLLDGDSLIIA